MACSGLPTRAPLLIPPHFVYSPSPALLRSAADFLLVWLFDGSTCHPEFITDLHGVHGWSWLLAASLAQHDSMLDS